MAAIAAEAAGRLGKFWEMHDLLFAHTGALTKSAIDDIAKGLFDAKQFALFDQHMADKALLEKVNSQKAYAQEALKVNATPTFFFNGRPYFLANTEAGFEQRLAMENMRKNISCNTGG